MVDPRAAGPWPCSAVAELDRKNCQNPLHGGLGLGLGDGIPTKVQLMQPCHVETPAPDAQCAHIIVLKVKDKKTQRGAVLQCGKGLCAHICNVVVRQQKVVSVQCWRGPRRPKCLRTDVTHITAPYFERKHAQPESIL